MVSPRKSTRWSTGKWVALVGAAALLPLSSVALGPVLSAGATTTTTVVKPSSMNGWYFWNDKNDTFTGSPGELVTGPVAAPLGTGSVRLGPLTDNGATAAGHSVIATNAYFDTPLANITSLGYSSFQPGPTLGIALQFDVRYRTTDSAYGGRLVFEPYQNGVVAVGPGWQSWSPLGGTWWASKTSAAGTGGAQVVALPAGNCAQSNPCTWSQIQAAFPSAKVFGRFLLKAGSNWNGFDGNADALTVGISGAETTYDFEPETACTTVCYVNGTTGNDSFGGDTAGTAKKTIQAAVTQVSPNGTVHVASGSYNEDVTVNKTLSLLGAGAASTTIVGPIGGGGSTIQVAGANVVIDGFTITRAGNNLTDWNNPGLNTAGIAIQSQGNSAEIRNNTITGMRTAIDINNSNGNSVHDNIIANNRTGMIFRNQTDNTTVTKNQITNNWTLGVLFLDASGGSNIPVQSASNSNFNRNNLSGNWYGQVADRQTGGALPAPGANLKNFECNWYGTATPAVSSLNSTEPGYAAQIPVGFGGAAVPPGSQPEILGPASANIDYVPFLITSDLNGSCGEIGQGDQPVGDSGNEGDTLNANGSFTGTGVTVAQTGGPGTLTDNGDGSWSWSYGTTDNFASTQVEVTGTDAYGNDLTQTFDISAANVAPTATLNAPASVPEGTSFGLSLTGVTDPSSADTTAGFTYAFNCGSGFGGFSASSTATCMSPLGGVTITVGGKVKDKDGGTNTYTASVSVVSGQAGKQAVITTLQGLLPSGDKETDKKLNEAIKELTKAVEPKQWIDPSHPSKNKTFNEEKNAVKHLMSIKNPSPAVTAAIDAIWKIDRVLAQTAINEAAGGDPKRLTNAAKEMAKAAVDIANGDFDKAIDNFRNAWKQATGA